MSDEAQRKLDEKLTWFREQGATKVKLGLTDIDGVIRGKYVSLEKFASLMRKQGGFCDCVLGWDVNDQLYDAGRFTGWHTGFPDASFRLVSATERWLADENCPYYIGEFVENGTADEIDASALCPRGLMRRQVDRFAEQGLAVRSGFEYEFFVFNESPHSVRDKDYRDLEPITPGNFGYSVLRNSVESELFGGLMDYCRALECDIEGLHCETGPGVWEAALQARLGIQAADRANLFKTFAKVYLQRHDLIGTFMAKWSMDYPGQSGHYHFSLEADERRNVFYDAEREAGISTMQRHAVGGLMQYLPAWLVMLAPTVNSYTRLVQGAWAPTAATWGIENRTTSIRVIPAGASGQRIEVRAGGADANPYLVGAAVLAAARLGIEQSIEPVAPVVGNAYELQQHLPVEQRFASNLRDSAQRLGNSEAAVEVFGSAFVEHFVMSRLWECAEYDRHINNWQLQRYFEII